MLSFLPVTYDRQGARCPASQRILVSPKAIVWEGEQYLLLAWDDGSQTLHRFRLDRMEEVTVTGCPAKGGQALLPPWAPFGEGTGLNRARVRLLCRESAVGDLLDCFGYDLPMEPKGDGLMVTADVTVTGDFWGWLVARNGQVEVAGPPWLAKLWELCYRPRTVE
jgi:hypothetical protein